MMKKDMHQQKAASEMAEETGHLPALLTRAVIDQ
jgi:hypothetical protein